MNMNIEMDSKWQDIRNHVWGLVLELVVLSMVLGLLNVHVWVVTFYWAASAMVSLMQILKLLLVVQECKKGKKEDVISLLGEAGCCKKFERNPIAEIIKALRLAACAGEAVAIWFLRDSIGWTVVMGMIILYFVLAVTAIIVIRILVHIAGVANMKEAAVLSDWRISDDYKKEKETVYDGMDGKSYKKNLRILIQEYYDKL